MFSPTRGLALCAAAFALIGFSARATVVIAPVPVPAAPTDPWSPYTAAGSYTVHVEDASNSSISADPLVHVHKVRYHRTSDGTPTGSADPLAVPPATSGDLDLVTNVYYTHFSFGGGPVKVTVTFHSPAPTPTSVTLSPTHFGITPTLAGNTVTFTISDSRYLILSVNNNSSWPYKLLIIADPLEVNPPQQPTTQGQNGVWDVTKAPYSADGTYTNAADTAINNAINDVHNAGGGTVFVPAGVYKLTNAITAHSNVSLYLAPGAYLRVADNLTTTSKIYCVNGSGISNFKIFGRGTLDANGVAAGGHQPSKDWISSTSYAMSGCLTMTSGCSGITLDGVVLRESALWTVFPAASDSINISNTKVVNYQQDFSWYRENDGLDLISCSNSNVTHCLVFTADDAMCLKGGYDSTYTKAADSCTYSDVVAYTGADGVKYGFQGYTAVQNSTFRNIEVVRAARPIALHVEHGTALFSNLAFLDITAEAIKGSSTSRPVDFDLRASPGADASNITIKNYTSPLATPVGGTNAYVQGSASGTFNGVHFTNCILGGTTITTSNYLTYFTVTSSYVSNLTFASAADTNQVLNVTPASFSSNWKVPPGSNFGIDKINDGLTGSTSEAQVTDSNDAWVIWDYGTTVKNFSSARVYQDNGTYSAQTWKLERWDPVGQAYVLVFDFTACPTNGWNSAPAFAEFATTKIRITFHPDVANGKLVGINEVEAYGH